jgi:DNA-binding beta-propeller fold protein YncE
VRTVWFSVLAVLVAVIIAAGVLTAVFPGISRSARVRDSGRSPAQLTAHSRTVRHFEYVASRAALYVYSIDRRNHLVQTVSLPQIGSLLHGVVADTRHEVLYISYGQQKPPGGSLLAYDLRGGHVLWHRTYSFGIDSMAVSRNGRWIYMPAGEVSSSGAWRIIATTNGKPTGRVINGPKGAHNTILSADGRYLYLGGVDYPYLEVASTATNRVIRKIGPLNPPGVRPFTINGSQTLAFTTAEDFLGFQVSSITTGKVLYTVPVPGFSFDPKRFRYTPDHGISLSPDARELYLIDTPNGYVHVFDVRGLPGSPPRLVANIKLHHPPRHNGWLQHTRNGRYVYVGRAGDVIDTRTRRIVDYLRPLRATADSLEIDWQMGKPVFTTNRYGVGRRLAANAGR